MSNYWESDYHWSDPVGIRAIADEVFRQGIRHAGNWRDVYPQRLDAAADEIESLRSQLTAATTERDSWESRTHTAAWESIELKRRAEAAEQALQRVTRLCDAADDEINPPSTYALADDVRAALGAVDTPTEQVTFVVENPQGMSHVPGAVDSAPAEPAETT